MEKVKVSKEIAELLDRQNKDDWWKQFSLIAHCSGYSGNGIQFKSIYTDEFKPLEKLKPLDYAKCIIIGYEVEEG